MGQVQSVFDKEVLHQYAECTYFTTKEIVYLYKKFSRLNSTKINPRVGDAITRLTFNEIKALPELHECPFAQRICEVFSTDREEGVNFEDFLDMMSVFSDRAAWNLKAAYAFKIFDFDDDSQINASDIEKTINSLTGMILLLQQGCGSSGRVGPNHFSDKFLYISLTFVTVKLSWE